jgi:hypothetical protein
MTDLDGCVVVRELASEVALGIAAAQERTQVLDHVVACFGCRAYLAELSGVAGDLLLLAPSAEPPSGFESAVLAQLHEPPTGGGRRSIHATSHVAGWQHLRRASC